MTREEAIRTLKEHKITFQHDFGWSASTLEAIEMAIKALEQESCEDAISLKAVIEWLKTKDIIKLSSQEETARKELKALSSVKPQEPCDCISRKTLIEYANNLKEGIGITANDIARFPSIQPKPKTGHWEWVQYDSNPNIGNWHCSECNRIVSGAISAVNPVYVYKYCPNCGAKMVEPQESKKVNCESTKCENCINHNYCDYEPWESEKTDI